MSTIGPVTATLEVREFQSWSGVTAEMARNVDSSFTIDPLVLLIEEEIDNVATVEVAENNYDLISMDFTVDVRHPDFYTYGIDFLVDMFVGPSAQEASAPSGELSWATSGW